jgi:myosin heavy subunit
LTSTGSTYIKAYESLKLEPHLFEVSARAYRGILLDNVNQSIFVSGLSGSGKTSTHQRLLDHMVSMDGLSTDDVHSSILLDRVRSSSRLLQALGGARTPLSSNSTRYGQITQLFFEFQSTGLLGFVGSRIDTCLLETSRVSDRTNGTMNFHIFYHMLKLPNKTKERLLGLRWTEAKAGDFAYLRTTEPDVESYDSETAQRVLQMLESFQCNNLDVREILRALASVLCLGNLSFVTTKDGEVDSAIQGRTDLDRLAACIGIDGTLIEQCLTTVTTQVNGETFVTPVSPFVARTNRDTLAKTIYSCVFEAVTRAINIHAARSLRADQEYSTITMVDLCGSENLRINRYEQLCINYANEKMQQKYLSDHRSSLTSDYEKEGVSIFSGLRIDNSTIVLAFLEGPGGLFETLKDVNSRRDGGTTVRADGAFALIAL